MGQLRRCALLVAGLAAFGAGPARALPGGASATGGVRGVCVLRVGDHGHAVRIAQRALGIRVDGRFGPATARATRRFQRTHRLVPTGCVDRATRPVLGLVRAPTAARVTLAPTELSALQAALGVTADGVLGPQTRAAIQAAQRRLRLPVDGVPTMQLLAALGVTVDAAAPAPGPAATMLRAALGELGRPYAWGAAGPDRFDCSGLVVWAAQAAHLVLPRTSYAQYGAGRAVAADAIRAGDLVFFTTGGPGASHVGIATDATHTVSATSHGVREHETFDAYWGAHYLGARRVG